MMNNEEDIEVYDNSIMGQLKSYKEEFDTKVKENGLMQTVPALFITFSAMLVHPLDILLGMDGLIGSEKNNPFSAPIGFAVGAITGLAGYLLGMIIRGITIIPSFIGSIADNVISRIFPSYKDLMAPITKKLDSLNFRTPETMTGLLGFVAGIIPELIINLAHQIVGVVSGVVCLIMESFNNGLRSIGRYLLGSKKIAAAEDNESELSAASKEAERAASSTLHVHGKFAKHQHGNGHASHMRHSLQLNVDASGDVSSVTKQGSEYSPTKSTSGQISPTSHVDELPHGDSFNDGEATRYSPSGSRT
jgi:hypothetical protein